MVKRFISRGGLAGSPISSVDTAPFSHQPDAMSATQFDLFMPNKIIKIHLTSHGACCGIVSELTWK